MQRERMFISYKRSERMTAAVDRFYRRIKAYNAADTFFDQRSIDAGDEWRTSIDEFLATATQFVAFVSIDFWLSDQCMRELKIAIDRYERERLPRLLFVLAEPLNPSLLVFDEEEAQHRNPDGDVARAKERVARVTSLGQINFLGPYAPGGVRVPLELDDRARREAQIDRLVGQLPQLKKD